ncbi:MAG: tol-pal system protein YbgF [Elusimicrobia bacterium]|nr:tol-pal system protein YbgF [Elusimicrobiota bacterium]MBD3412069.1 tol-pal system protein YbgF [Elusimicrobiota bacterium]
MFLKTRGVYGIVLILFLGGCATSRDMQLLNNAVLRLQKSQDSLQANQADLSAQIVETNDIMVALSEQLVDSRERMSLLAQRLDDIDANLSNRMDDLSRQLSGAPQSVEQKPSQIFRIAFRDYTRGKYDLAQIGFRNYLEKYPGTELAEKAVFYLAECSYAKKDFEQAYQQYNELIKKYPRHEFVADAMLKKGMCLERMNKMPEAEAVYRSLIDKHPDSPSAEKAREYLRSTNDKTEPEKQKPAELETPTEKP